MDLFGLGDKASKTLSNQGKKVTKSFDNLKKLQENTDKKRRKEAFEISTSQKTKEQAKQAEELQNIRKAEADMQSSQARGSQEDFINNLKAQAAGNLDTAAQQALRKSNERSQAQRQAIQASQAGTTSAGLRAAAQAKSAANIQQQADSSQLRVAEQIAAQEQLAKALQQQATQDIQQQQFQTGQQLQNIENYQTLGQQQQQASARDAQLQVEKDLAKKGLRLQGDINQILTPNAFGEFGNAIFDTGMAYASNIVTGYSKGGKTDANKKNNKIKVDSKMSEDEKFGFKKALESNLGDSSKFKVGGKAYKVSNKYEKKLEPIKKKTLTSIEENKIKEADAAANYQKTRESQTSLIDDIKKRSLGNGPSLAQVQMKSASDKSLAEQLAASQAGNRPIQQAQLQQALMQNQQQRASDLAARAAQAQATESQAAGQLGYGSISNVRGADINRQQFAQQAANQSLIQQANVLNQDVLAKQAYKSLEYDKKAAERAMNAQKRAAKKQAYDQAGPFGRVLMDIERQGYSEGGFVDGTAPKKGDHEDNDIINAKLSPGEVVIPRTVVNKGLEAQIGFIKGIEEMTKNNKDKYSYGGKVQKYSEGGPVLKNKKEDKKLTKSQIEGRKAEDDYHKKQKDEKDKEKSRIASAAVAGVQAIGTMAGEMDRKKIEKSKENRSQAESEFLQALSKIKSRRNYSKGGKVSADTYGMVLKARNELNAKLKELDKKKKK